MEWVWARARGGGAPGGTEGPGERRLSEEVEERRLSEEGEERCLSEEGEERRLTEDWGVDFRKVILVV